MVHCTGAYLLILLKFALWDWFASGSREGTEEKRCGMCQLLLSLGPRSLQVPKAYSPQ